VADKPSLPFPGNLTGLPLSVNDRFMETTFTGEELRNTVSFDPDRQLRGEGGEGLLGHVLGLVAAAETRERALKVSDAPRRRLTASTLLANIAAAAINRVDPKRFVTVSFNRNNYAGTGLSVAAMTAMREVLLDQKMIEGRSGVRSVGRFDDVHSALTRLRAAPALIDLLGQYGIGYSSIVRRLDRGTIVLKDRRQGIDRDPPPDVALTASVIEGMNRLIAKADINLPDDAWDRIIARHAAAATLDQKERADAGDLAATALYRSFKFDWQHGGRMYGGWWIGLPKEERAHLTINGQRTVELDYSQLHPSILFARVGRPLDFDLYTLPGLDSPALREVGKDTFMRLLNRTADKGGSAEVRMRAGDRKLLPADVTPEDYMRRFLVQMAPIGQWLSTGEGTRLQREDSDLAIEVMAKMMNLGAVVLPVHDSFVVEKEHSDSLMLAMRNSYERKYGITPLIK
jgi:hypothetical protein